MESTHVAQGGALPNGRQMNTLKERLAMQKDPNNFPHPHVKAQTKICAISDLHEQWAAVKVPQCDILVIAGDITYEGKWEKLYQFVGWMEKLQEDNICKDIVVIAGNHDITAQTEPKRFADLMRSACTYLNEEMEIVQGLTFFGSPWTPWFYDWAFNAHRGRPMAEHWAMIPDNVDVLVTHTPPYGACDIIPDGRRVGCVDLANEVLHRVKPKLHICGHIHHSHGLGFLGNTLVMNAATCTEKYKPLNPPLVVTM